MDTQFPSLTHLFNHGDSGSTRDMHGTCRIFAIYKATVRSFGVCSSEFSHLRSYNLFIVPTTTGYLIKIEKIGHYPRLERKDALHLNE